MTDLPDDPTLDEVRAALAPLIAHHAAFDGWRATAVDSAARQAGIDTGLARLAFDADRRGGNAIDMIDAWFASIDARMIAALPPEALADKGVSARITALVNARLDLLAPDREALRRALATLAMPQNIVRAGKLGWRTADRIWRAAGDTATDYNHYTKRATLSAVYAATMLVFLDDESEGLTDTRAFLTRRIADIGRFEKAKARFASKGETRISLSRFIGRLRYPAI
mgnify:CR=1 FL=1